MWNLRFTAPRLAAACLWLASLCARPVWAHLMPAQQGTLNVVGDAVFAVLALPASLVPQADANAERRLLAEAACFFVGTRIVDEVAPLLDLEQAADHFINVFAGFDDGIVCLHDLPGWR